MQEGGLAGKEEADSEQKALYIRIVKKLAGLLTIIIKPEVMFNR